jgi:anti-sigma factor RsiW
MTCSEAGALIPAWVDQELSVQDSAALERHLKVCPDCAKEASLHGAFVAGLKEQLPKIQIPPDLKARVMNRLRSSQIPSPAPERFGRWIREGVLAGAALVALVLVLAHPRDSQSAWTQFYRDDHQAHSGGQFQVRYRSDSPREVAAWLGKNLGHPVHVPIMKDAALVGGNLTVLKGQRVALAVYHSGSQTVSLFVGDPKTLCPSFDLPQDELYADAGTPYNLVAWQHHGHFHILVADIGLSQLKELAHQCQVSAI